MQSSTGRRLATGTAFLRNFLLYSLAMLKESASEALIAQLFDNQPDGVVWYAPVLEPGANEKIVDFEVVYCNHTAARMVNANRDRLTGHRLMHTAVLDEASAKLIFSQCLEVWTTGEAIEYTYYNTGFDCYFNVQRSRVNNGILSITRDRTKEVRAEMERQEQEKMYQQILNTSADGIMHLKSIRNENGEIIDFRLAHCNNKGMEMGRFPADAVGKRLLQLLPHLQQSDQLSRHKAVVETGVPQRFETTFYTPGGEAYGWFIVSLTKMADGVISTFVDVWEKKSQEQQILEQKTLLNNILDASLSAIYTCQAVRDKAGVITDFTIVQVNQRFREEMVVPGVEVIGRRLLTQYPATRQTPLPEKLAHVVETGQPARFEVNYKIDGYSGWYDVSAVRLTGEQVVVTFANITDQKNVLLELQQQKNLLSNILLHSANGISVTKVIRNAQGAVVDGRTILANDAAVRFTGIPRELYLSKTAAELDPAIIDSPYYQLCLLTLQTGEPQFTQYFLDFSKRWLEISISRLDEDHIITIFTDVTPAREAQLQRENYLQELKRSNESLEEFTRAASHDLKEPIRKVQYFSGRLKTHLEGRLNEEEKSMMERMENAADRMKLLVDDLLSYSHVNQQPAEREDVDLTKKLLLVQADLELLIAEKQATITAGPLPAVKGYRRQLQQLFHNLISNALKYHKPGVPPVVQITAAQTTGAGSGLKVAPADAERLFYLIEVRDNGIGFDQADAERIFNVFTRLHGNHEYSGTGVGLAIVRKVVENHQGYIAAESEPDKGAWFKVLLRTEE